VVPHIDNRCFHASRRWERAWEIMHCSIQPLTWHAKGSCHRAESGRIGGVATVIISISIFIIIDDKLSVLVRFRADAAVGILAWRVDDEEALSGREKMRSEDKAISAMERENDRIRSQMFQKS
jgi:hypothetical protein